MRRSGILGVENRGGRMIVRDRNCRKVAVRYGIWNVCWPQRKRLGECWCVGERGTKLRGLSWRPRRIHLVAGGSEGLSWILRLVLAWTN